MGKLKIYKSSAGSGKTYTIVQDFLLLALQNPKNFCRILAVTFTNKATSEMKSRILETTTEISENSTDENLLKKLKQELKYTDQQLKEAALSLRYEILHNYGQFNISTIDSFFHKVIRSFARDLNIPVNFNISLDYEQVTNDVVNEMFSGINVNDSLYKHLNDMLKTAIQNAKSRNIKWQIMESCYLLHTLPAYVITEMNNYDDIQKTIDTFSTYSKTITLVIKDFENRIDEHIQKIEEILSRHDIDTNAFKRGATNIIPKWKDKDYTISTTAQNIYKSGFEAWTTKSKPNTSVIMAANEGVHEHFCLMYDLLFSADFKLYNTLQKILAIIPYYIVFTHIQKQLENFKKNNDLLLNHDIVNFLNEIISVSGDAPFVYEKTGLFFQHYCMDEFQDTSPTQWNCFVPLLDNALSLSKENIIVGDVKQAIYRFRGGDWKLLNSEIEESFINRIEKNVLGVNYRSSKNIVHTIGFIFTQFIERLAFTFPEGQFKQYNPILKKIYQDVEQSIAPHREEEKANKGIVQFTAITNDKEVKWKDTAVSLAIKQIEKLQLSGVPPDKVCLLVRNSQEGEYFMEGLKDYILNGHSNPICSYKIASQDALFIHQALVVQILTIALSLFNVANLLDAKFVYLDQLLLKLHDEKNSEQSTSIDRDEKRLKKIHRDIQSVIPLPFYDALESLIGNWNLNTISDEAAYLNAFMDLVYAFTRNTSGDPKDFLKYWDKVGNEQKLEISSNESTIQLMTIHKSKGLQFDYVILPFLNWTLIETKHRPVMWIKPSFKDGNDTTPTQQEAISIVKELPHFPIQWSSKGFENTYFYDSYLDECFQMIVENTNLMYVAMTRAKEGLFCYFENITSDTRTDTIGKIIGDILALPSSSLQEIEVDNNFCKRYQIGSMDEIDEKLYTIDEKDIDSLFEIKYRKSSSWQKRIKIRPIDGNTASTYFGTKIHQLLSEIIYWDDVKPTIGQAFQKGVMDKKDVQRCHRVFKAIKNNPDVYNIFQPNDNVTVKTEIPIIVGSGNQLRIDRLHINNKDNSAVIYDYKSGKSDSKLSLVKYRNQMTGYKNTIRAMGYNNVEAYILHLEKGKVEKII